MPITVPPLNATSSAAGRPTRAAAVVRTFALVATFMPAQPEIADASAPTMNEAAMSGLRPSPVELAAASKPATMTTKIASTLYSAFKKAIAPSWMRAAISFILSSPASFLPIAVALMKAKSRARTPAAGAA